MPKLPRIRRRVLTPGSAVRINGFRPDPSLRATAKQSRLRLRILRLSLDCFAVANKKKALNALKSLDAELKSAVSFPHE
jgi:hypothetical protein